MRCGVAVEKIVIARRPVPAPMAAKLPSVDAAARTTLNGTDECDPIEFGTRIRYFELWKKRPPEELLGLAIEHLTDATMIGYGETPLSDAAAAVREFDLNQAAADAKLAIAHGRKDLGKLKSHPDSDALLKREELKPLLDGLVPPP
jgi:hypothetical protein